MSRDLASKHNRTGNILHRNINVNCLVKIIIHRNIKFRTNEVLQIPLGNKNSTKKIHFSYCA